MIAKSYATRISGVNFNLEFKDNLTLIDGNSGTGKTFLYKKIKKDSLVNNKNIICLDYNDTNSEKVDYILNNSKGKIIVIDNAEVVLNIRQRLRISFDRDNQYIIFTHSFKGFKPGKFSFTTLVVEKNRGYLKFDLG